MVPLVEELYHIAAEKWNLALGLLDSEEYFEYQRCSHFFEEQNEWLTRQLTGEELTTWKHCLANLEQVRDTECRLCFARGLAMGLGLGGFGAGK